MFLRFSLLYKHPWIGRSYLRRTSQARFQHPTAAQMESFCIMSAQELCNVLFESQDQPPVVESSRKDINPSFYPVPEQKCRNDLALCAI